MFGGLMDRSYAAAAKSRRCVARCADVSRLCFSIGVLSRGEIVDGWFRLSVSAEGAIMPKA